MATNISVDFSASTQTGTWLPVMKRLQPQKEIDRLWQQNYPLLSMVRKVDDFEGTMMDIPVEYDHPFVSRTFSDATDSRAALQGRSPSQYAKFALKRTRMYGVGRADAETMRASRSDKGAWLRLLQRETQNIVLSMRKRAAIQLYRGTGGALGQIATSGIGNGDGTNDRLTLTVKTDVYHFSRGMSCTFDSADGGGTQHSNTVPAIVRKIDPENGYVYFGSDVDTAVNLETVTTNDIADADYIFAAGDYGNSFNGVADWIPFTTPSSGATFLGVTRSTGSVRLFGHRLDDTSISREELVQELAARISYCDGSNLTCFMSPIQVKEFALELDTKVVRDPGGKGRTGFRGIMVDTGSGEIEVLADPACPQNRMYLLDMSTWTFHHLDPFPHLVEDEGLARTRVSDADMVEFRYRAWGNLACDAPGRNGVASLPLVL